MSLERKQNSPFCREACTSGVEVFCLRKDVLLCCAIRCSLCVEGGRGRGGVIVPSLPQRLCLSRGKQHKWEQCEHNATCPPSIQHRTCLSSLPPPHIFHSTFCLPYFFLSHISLTYFHSIFCLPTYLHTNIGTF